MRRSSDGWLCLRQYSRERLPPCSVRTVIPARARAPRRGADGLGRGVHSAARAEPRARRGSIEEEYIRRRMYAIARRCGWKASWSHRSSLYTKFVITEAVADHHHHHQRVKHNKRSRASSEGPAPSCPSAAPPSQKRIDVASNIANPPTHSDTFPGNSPGGADSRFVRDDDGGASASSLSRPTADFFIELLFSEAELECISVDLHNSLSLNP